MSAIAIEQLTKRYGSRIGVDGLSLAVPEGSIYGFLGPNGSGKTTTIRVLLGFLKASTGRASVFGRDCWRESRDIKRELGYVSGDLRLHSWMTARDALRIAGLARGIDLVRPGIELAECFGLEHGVKVRRMSRGMRQKLGLILALVHEPKLLILDEPTSSLDPLTQDRLYEHLRLLAGRGRTVFFSSHVLSEVEELCHRVAILREGRLMADDTLEHLRELAPRAVTIQWPATDGGQPAPPQGLLTLRERRDNTWDCDLTGPVPDLLAWLTRQSIEDVFIGRPNLESLFRRFYEGDHPC